MTPSPNARSILAKQLRAARRRAGLSGRDLAELGGLSQATVSAIERGRDVEHGTLQGLMNVLPGLDPRLLLGRPALGPRPTSLRLWRYFADMMGFRARRISLSVRLDASGGQASEFEVTGLRCTDGSPDDHSRCISLMGVALVGSLRATFGLRGIGDAEAGETIRIEDGDLLHVFDIPADLRRQGLNYRRVERGPPRPAGSPLPGQAPHGLPFELGACFWLDYPTERLVFRVEFEGGDRPTSVRPEIWPASIGVDPSGRTNLWSDLFPHAPTHVGLTRQGAAEVRIDHPLPGPCYGLSWGHAEPPDTPARSPTLSNTGKTPALADVLVRARRRAGLSSRALARKLELSPSTLIALEGGSDARLSTLKSYADALDDLSPFELFQPFEPAGEPDRLEVWTFQRDFFGMEAMEESTLIRINKSGDMAAEMTTKGLTWTQAAARDLRLRHGLTRVPGGSTWELDSILTKEEDEAPEAKVKVLRRGTGPVLHELRFQPGTGKRRVSFTRKLIGRGQFLLTRARARKREQRARDWEAIYVEPSIPTHSLRIELRFPRGYFPPGLTVRVIARSSMVAATDEDIGRLIHPSGFNFQVDPKAHRAELQVAKPLVGLRYLFTWGLS